jgi:hypothetical protein
LLDACAAGKELTMGRYKARRLDNGRVEVDLTDD